MTALRRTGWLTVLGVAAAGTYAASRARSLRRAAETAGRKRLEHPVEATPGSSPAERSDALDPREREPVRTPGPAAAAAEAPTGAVTMVPLGMEPTSAVQLQGAERNGSAVGLSGDGTASVRPRILGPLELPAPRRPSASTLAGLAALAAVAAVALGAAGVVSGLAADEDSAGGLSDARRALALLSKPSTERIPLEGSGRAALLAVGSEARGFLVLRRLAPAPAGLAYEAWVVAPGRPTPLPAAVFSGSERLVPLSRPVPPGARVTVSVESQAGSDVPTKPFLFVGRRPAS